jgi:hypothetical protein
MMFFVELSKWRSGDGGRSGEAFFNKRSLVLFWFWSSPSLLSFLDGPRGEEKGAARSGELVICSAGGEWGVYDTTILWSSSSDCRLLMLAGSNSTTWWRSPGAGGDSSRLRP